MSWNISKLGEECKIFSGNSINAKTKESLYTNVEGTPYIATKDITYDGNINYLNGISIPDEDHDKFRKAKSECVFICAEGGSAGRKIAFSDTECFFVNKLFCLEAGSNLLPKYIYYYLRSEAFQIQFKNALTGLIGGVSLSKIKLFEITYPSLSVQKQIVEKLDAAFADIDKAISATEKNIENAEAMFQSYLNKLFNENLKDGNAGKLGDYCKIVRGGSPRPIKRYLTNKKSGVNWIKISDATKSDKYIFETKEKIIEDGISKSRLVNDGDFILSNSMSFGRPYIMRTTGCIHDGWLALSGYESSFEQDYLYFLLGSDLIFNQFDKLARGSTVRNLNISIVSNLEINVPSKNNQKIISRNLNVVSKNIKELKKIYIKKLEELTKLKISVLNQAFSGELTKDAA